MKKFNNNYRATVKNTLLEMMYMSGTLCEAPDEREGFVGLQADLDAETKEKTDREEAEKQKEEIQKKEDNPNHNYENKNERIKQVEDMAKKMADSSSFKLNASTPASTPTSTSKNGRREHDLLTQDEAENGNPRENRIKTQRRLEALSPEERRTRVVAANDKRKKSNDAAFARLTPEEQTAQKAKPTGAWRIDPATGEKLKDVKGNVMDPKEYAAIDKKNGIKTPSEFGDGRTLGQRLAGVGKHQRVYEPMTKADQQKRYDNSSKDINNPGYDNSEYGKQQRQKESDAIVNKIIDDRNFSKETAAYSAEVKRNRESGSTKRIDLSDKGNYPTLSRSNAKKEADKDSAKAQLQANQEVADYEASDEGKKEAERYKRVNAAITAGSLAARAAQVAARL